MIVEGCVNVGRPQVWQRQWSVSVKQPQVLERLRFGHTPSKTAEPGPTLWLDDHIPADDIPDFNGKSFQQMGFKKSDPSQLVRITETYADQMAQKKLLSEKHPDQVFNVLPGSHEASRHVLNLLVPHLTRHYPAMFQREGENLHNVATGETWNLTDSQHHPLFVAGRLVQEDLLLMQKGAGDETPYSLVAASLHFPNKWNLQEKIGKTMAQIHQPVPFPPEVQANIDKFIAALAPDTLLQRVNWGILEKPTLFQPDAASDVPPPPVTAANAGQQLYMRIERSPFYRLSPYVDFIFFAIRTYRARLDAFLTQHPGTAERLAHAIGEVFTPEQLAYKGITRWKQPLLAYLDHWASQEAENGSVQKR